MERGWQAGSHVPSLGQHASVDCKYIDLHARNCAKRRAPLRNRSAHGLDAGHLAPPWPPGPSHHNTGDLRSPTPPVDTRGRDASLRGPAEQPARPGGGQSWTGAVPYVLDAIQTDGCAPLLCAQRFRTSGSSGQGELGFTKKRYLTDAAPTRMSVPKVTMPPAAIHQPLQPCNIFIMVASD